MSDFRDLTEALERKYIAGRRAAAARASAPGAAAAKLARNKAQRTAVKADIAATAAAAAAPVLSPAAAKAALKARLRAKAPHEASPAAAAAVAASSAYIASMTPSGARKLALRRIDVVDGIDPRDGLFYVTLDDATRVVVGSSFFKDAGTKKAKILDNDFLRLDAPVMFERVTSAAGPAWAKGEVRSYNELRAVFKPAEEEEWTAAGFL